MGIGDNTYLISANKKKIFWIFLGGWLVINILQAYFTGLFHDEAYYFFYSRELAWGYYDHPPLTALLIKMGYLVFYHELGVRFMFILLSAGTALLIYKLAEIKNALLFGVMLFAFLFFQITGFMALPDSLLVFFTVLFFLVYKRYCETFSIRGAVLLGLVMAGMFYSKYLGILVVFFTVMANYRLLFKRSFWLAVAITTLLFVPHLIWQYNHDFPSFYYHLRERSHDEIFRWTNFGDYIIGQFAQANPFLFIPALYFLIRFKPLDAYDKALKVTALGCLLLPFLLMARGRVEANWTMAGLVPFFLLSYRLLENNLKIHRFIYIAGAITFLAVMLIRVAIAFDFLPENYTGKVLQDVRGWKGFSEEVSKLAGNRPVVFVGAYQLPSQYIFYTGKEAFSFNNALYRKNQFDLEDIERALQGKEVLVITPKKNIALEDARAYELKFTDSLLFPNGKYRPYVLERNYRSYNFIEADILLPDGPFLSGKTVNIPVILRNPGSGPVDFRQARPAKVYLTCYLLQYGKPVIYDQFEDLSEIVLTDEYRTSFTLKIPAKPGVYYLKVSLKSGWMPPGINSRLVKIKVK